MADTEKDESITWSPFMVIRLDGETEAYDRIRDVVDRVIPSSEKMATLSLQPKQLVLGMLFQIECALVFQVNQLLPMAELMSGRKGPLMPKQKQAVLEWYGTLFCGLSSVVPAICQLMTWAKANNDKEFLAEVDRVARLSANTNTGLRIMGEVLKEESIWPHVDSVPINKDMAGLLARSMGLASPEIMKATLDEATAAKEAAGGDRVKALSDVWNIAQAATKIEA